MFQYDLYIKSDGDVNPVLYKDDSLLQHPCCRLPPG